MARKYSSGQMIITTTDAEQEDLTYRLGGLKEDAADDGVLRVAQAFANLREENTLKLIRISKVHEITIE